MLWIAWRTIGAVVQQTQCVQEITVYEPSKYTSYIAEHWVDCVGSHSKCRVTTGDTVSILHAGTPVCNLLCFEPPM